VRKISPPPGFDPRTFQPVASRYTDYAIPAAKGTDEHCSCSSAFEDGTFLRIYILSDFDNVNAFFDKAKKANVIQYVFVQNYNIRYTMWLLKEYRKWKPNKEDQLIWERCPKEGICKWDNKFVNAKLIVSKVTN
jgi:hypothetical protein